MAEVKFYLKKANDAGLSKIRLQYRCSTGPPYRTYTGRKIKPAHWHKGSRQQPDQQAKPSWPGAAGLNSYLQALRDKVQGVVDSLRLRGITVTASAIDREMKAIAAAANTEHAADDVIGFIENFVKQQQAEHDKKERGNPIIGEERVKTYRVLYKKHLTGFLKYRNATIFRFGDIDQRFFDDMVAWLIDRKPPMEGSSIHKYLTTLKAAMKLAVKRKVSTNRDYDLLEIDVEIEEGDPVFLSEAELEQIYAARPKMLEHSNGANLARECDRLVLGCCIGLRIGDNVRLGPENIERRPDGLVMVRMKTGKSGENVLVPLLHDAALEILERYDWSPPPAPTIKNINELFKVVCEVAKINAPVIHKSGAMVSKYTQVSTHTMRRSFATNLFLRGVPSHLIMKLTGHRSERSFLRYIRIDKVQAAELVAKHYLQNTKK